MAFISLWKKLYKASIGEWQQTKCMLSTSYRYLRYKKHLCQKCREVATSQFYDIPKFLPFVLVLFFPIPGITELYLGLAVFVTKCSKGKLIILPSEYHKILIPSTSIS